MSIDAGPGTLEWVALGTRACGLVFAGRIVAVVYWHGAEDAELREHSGAPDVGEAGFSWVPADLAVDHFVLFEAPNPQESDWIRARELAAGAYSEWTLQEASRTAELRREAAELLSRSRWWRNERMPERLLSRRWHGPPWGERG
jgi:hypothetical protein